MKKFTSKLVASAMAATMAMSMIGGFGASAVECEEHNNVGSFLISDSIVNMANAYNPNLTGHYFAWYPTEKQPSNSSTCWAYSIRSICRYRERDEDGNSAVTIETLKAEALLYDEDGNIDKGIKIGTAEKILNSHFPSSDGYNVHQVSELTYTNMENSIRKACPVYLNGVCTTDNTVGHACVAIGYKYDSQTKELLGIRFYNPATGQLEECDIKNGGFYFKSGSREFKVNKSIMLI